MRDIALSTHHLAKLYRIGTYNPYAELRDYALFKAKQLKRRLFRQPDPTAFTAENYETIWALKDISFDVRRGESVGIIGRNGAGKSTLLKILSRITKPTSGYAEVFGRLGSLLEVGTGFHGELTGRENIFLNASILGMDKRSIESRFDEIVDFAEIEKFIDTPVKFYSSGMYMRLAFSVAAHLDPDILILDEVLSVGDAAFQEKCMGKMDGITKHEGRTIIFVSHNMAAVQKLCPRSILLENGRITADGPTEEVVLRYLDNPQGNGEQVWHELHSAPGDDAARLRSVKVLDSSGSVRSELRTGEAITIETDYWIIKEGAQVGVTVVLFDKEGNIILSSISNHEKNWHGKPRPEGLYRSICHLPGNFLSEGDYSITIILWGEYYRLITQMDSLVRFLLIDSGDVRGDYLGGWEGFVRPLLAWETYRVDA